METVFIRLFNTSVTATWITLAVILLRPLLKKAPKTIRVFMWALVAFRLICPFSFESALSLVPSAETVPPDIIYSEAPTIHSGIVFFNSTINPIISESLAPKPEASVNPMQVITQVATVVWAVGVLLMLLYALFSYLRVYRKVKEAGRLEGNIWLCDRIDTPFILGVFRPRIYLPSSISETDMGYVIAHEQAHLKRLDHIWKPLGFLLLTVYWFNPVFWVAYVMLCKDIELACDERVIKALGDEGKKPYSEALINCSASRKAISACPLAFGEVGVKERVKAVLSYKKATFWIILAAIIACVVLAVVFLTNPPEKDNTENDSSVSGVGGVDPPENVVVTPSVEELKEKYPEYFEFTASDSLDVFIWQTEENVYSCSVMARAVNTDINRGAVSLYIYNRLFSDEELKEKLSNSNYQQTEFSLRYYEKICALKPTTIEEMHVILACSMVPTERIRLFPIARPNSEYQYAITDEYIEKVIKRFWDNVKFNTGALDLSFALPMAEVDIDSIRYDKEGISLGLDWKLFDGFTEATKSEYPKYHIKISIGDNSRFTFLPLPEEWTSEDTGVHSTYRIDMPAEAGDDIVIDLYLNDDKTFLSNLITIVTSNQQAPETPSDNADRPQSYTTFDIDGDSTAERVELNLGSTSGFYTFVVEADGGYRSEFLSAEYKPFRFCTMADGTIALECHSAIKAGDVRYYTIELNGKAIVLRHGEETMRYWGD